MRTAAEIQARIDYLNKQQPKSSKSYVKALEWCLTTAKPNRYHQQFYYAAVREELIKSDDWQESFAFKKEIGWYYRSGATVEECVEGLKFYKTI